MKISLSWLKEFVDIKFSPKELADKLSLLSIGVKEFTSNYLELDLTYNRGDLLSLRGVAREVAAITGSSMKFTNDHPRDTNLPKTEVEIEDEKLSPVQCVAKIEGLTIGQSNPEWIKKLNASGMRSINNLVDVTNLIMLEFGQPLHAFDAKLVEDETIIVRAAKENEELVTLDNKLRKLSSSDIVLADTKKALDVAGVMGSKETEVTESTNSILLSASMFNPAMVRNTSKKLGLYSEASKRFQHGLTRTSLLQAYFAAIKMYEGLGGKLTAINLVGDFEEKLKTIVLNYKKLNSLIGIEIPAATVKSSLKSLGCNVVNLPGCLKITPPYWRLDINIEEDLIEEVARIYGYEKILPQKLRDEMPDKLDESLQDRIYNLKLALKNAGLTEVQTYSFFSSQILNALRLPLNALLKVANPISAETKYLRNNLWPNLVEVVAKNIKKGYKDIAIFEIGKVYNPKKEQYRLAIALMNESDNPLAELAQISRGLKLSNTGCLKPGELFHPKRVAENMAEVHPRLLNKFGIDSRVAILEVALETTPAH